MGEYYEYKTLQGDTFDSISLDFYDNELLAHKIMVENPEHISTIIFHSGVILKIPVMENLISLSLPPWKRGGSG